MFFDNMRTAFLLFAVTYLVYKSFMLNFTSAGVVITLQGMISVAVDMLPLPGGLGISEKLFKDIFVQVCTKKYYTACYDSEQRTLVFMFSSE